MRARMERGSDKSPQQTTKAGVVYECRHEVICRQAQHAYRGLTAVTRRKSSWKTQSDSQQSQGSVLKSMLKKHNHTASSHKVVFWSLC